MPPDRQSIERKDFPVGLRGYDPAAVDAHLAALADEIADYIEAAENSAADLRRTAGPVPARARTAVGVAADEPPAYAQPSEDDQSAEPSEHDEGARLIALNMALNGTAREETARYLSENFTLSDRDGLLDDVYASVEG